MFYFYSNKMPTYILKEHRTHWKVPSYIRINLKENWHDLINYLLDYPVMHLVRRVTANFYVIKVVQKQHSFTERHLILSNNEQPSFLLLFLWWRHVNLCFIEVWWLMVSPHTGIFNNCVLLVKEVTRDWLHCAHYYIFSKRNKSNQ